MFGDTGADVESELFLFRLFTFLVILIKIVIYNVVMSYLGAPTSWLGTANVGSDCSMKLMKSKVSKGTDDYYLFYFYFQMIDKRPGLTP